MNQQISMSTLSAYPAPKASDVLLWQELGLSALGEAPKPSADAAAQSALSGRLEKILLTTRLSWATR